MPSRYEAVLGKEMTEIGWTEEAGAEAAAAGAAGAGAAAEERDAAGVTAEAMAVGAHLAAAVCIARRHCWSRVADRSIRRELSDDCIAAGGRTREGKRSGVSLCSDDGALTSERKGVLASCRRCSALLLFGLSACIRLCADRRS